MAPTGEHAANRSEACSARGALACALAAAACLPAPARAWDGFLGGFDKARALPEVFLRVPKGSVRMPKERLAQWTIPKIGNASASFGDAAWNGGEAVWIAKPSGDAWIVPGEDPEALERPGRDGGILVGKRAAEERCLADKGTPGADPGPGGGDRRVFKWREPDRPPMVSRAAAWGTCLNAQGKPLWRWQALAASWPTGALVLVLRGGWPAEDGAYARIVRYSAGDSPYKDPEELKTADRR